jgi:CheY-like chemotaxis protein
MRVLIAEDDVVAATRLQRILGGLGHEVEVVRDGLAAEKYLEKDARGVVAILNDNLPGKGGCELASNLRARSWVHYPFIILLGATRGSCGAVTALQAGADNFLALPVSPAALAAQLKVAERILKHQDQAHRTIRNLQEQLRAQQVPALWPVHENMPEKSFAPKPVHENVPEKSFAPKPVRESVPEKSFAPVVSPEPGLPKVSEEVTPNRAVPDAKVPVRSASATENPSSESKAAALASGVESCFTKVLRRIRYHAGPDNGNSGEQPDFTVYSALVLEDQRRWFDLKMEVSRRVATALYRALLSEAPPSDTELYDALEEVGSMCQSAWKADLENTGLEPIVPGGPVAKRTREVPLSSKAKQLSSTTFTLPGPIRVTLLEYTATVVDKPLAAVLPGDVLADPVRVAGRKVELLKRGTVLTARYIARIHEALNPSPDENFKLHVIEPSPLGMFMRRRWPRKAVDSSLTVLVRIGGMEKQLSGRVRDISENGLGAVIFDTLNLGQTVTLVFGLGDGAEFRFEAVVRHRQPPRCGFEFLSVPTQSMDKLREAVELLSA